MKTSNSMYFCSLLIMICNFFVSIPAKATCELPVTTHAENVNALTTLLPGDARGVLAVDIHDLLSGSSASAVTGLLNGQGTDAALNEPFCTINTLAENFDVTGAVKTALLVQTTGAPENLLLLATLRCDTISEVIKGPGLTSEGTYGAGAHGMYTDLNGNSVSLLKGGVLIVGKRAVVQSVLDVVDTVSPSHASVIDSFLLLLRRPRS